MPPGPTLEFLAGHDLLTGLGNRRTFEATLADAVEGEARDGGALAVLYLDLNGFKLVNDSFGHALGDELLRDVATRLSAAIDDEHEVLSRLGGDEFGVVVSGLPEAGGGRLAAEAVGHRLGDALQGPFTLGEVEIHVDAAIGVSVLPEDADQAEALCRQADAAMYEAKRTGAAVLLHSAGTPDPLERIALAARLRRAIERGELVVHYQPIVRLPDERIMGLEALVRWEDPEHGLVGPDRFIDVAESTGVIEALGDWVFTTLCRQAADWRARGLEPNFGYNVSERQLRRPGFAAALAATAAEHGVNPGRVVCELTETAWSVDPSRMLPALTALRAAGFALAIDDFGAGYSSLWRLRQLDVQVIKVDRAFLRDVPEDPRATAVVTAITQLAEACECDVVAEGVETPAQLEFLVGRRCRLAQGYHFARPVPAREIERLLERQLVADRRTAAA